DARGRRRAGRGRAGRLRPRLAPLAQPLKEPPMTHARPVVLCVDDDPDILASVARLLRRDGYEVVTANAPNEALQVLTTRPIAVMVSDFEMPEMTGVELAVRARAAQPETVRILL